MSVRKYTGKRLGTTWHVVLELGRDAEGKRLQEVLREDPETGLPMRTKRRAEEVEREALVKRHRGGVVLPDSTPLVTYLWRWWQDTADQREANTQYTYASIIRCRLSRGIGEIPLGRLSAMHLNGFFREQNARYAPATVRATRRVLAAALNQAVQWRLIDRSPLDGVRIAKEHPSEPIAWTAEQAKTFLSKTSGDSWGPLWRLLLDSGMRIGEAMALRWDDLDMDAAEVQISRTMTIVSQKGERGPSKSTKTAAGQRTVSLAPETIMALRRHHVRQLERRLSLGEYWIDTGAIFDHGDGRYSYPEIPRYHFGRAVLAHGLPEGSTPHCLRHTCATLLAAAGEPLHAIKERLGHSDIGITANLYAHSSREADKRLSETLARIIAS